jgi:hypothetical protein
MVVSQASVTLRFINVYASLYEETMLHGSADAGGNAKACRKSPYGEVPSSVKDESKQSPSFTCRFHGGKKSHTPNKLKEILQGHHLYCLTV